MPAAPITFTAPLTGIYQVYWTAVANTSVVLANVNITSNNTSIAINPAWSGGTQILSLKAGDVVGGNTSMQVCRIGT